MDLGRSGQVLIFTSSEIEEEIEKKLRTKFGLSDEETAQILLDFSTFTVPVIVSRRVSVIDDDPDDDKFIECAVASRAGFIVSGDNHLLDLEEKWLPVVRYDTRHGFAHRDLLDKNGKKQKTPMFTEDYSEALTFAEYDIQSNWRIYKERFLKGD